MTNISYAQDSPETVSKPAIIFNNFSYRYPGQKDDCLKEITCSINRGEFVVVTGHTGAGKTTCCLASAGILQHEYGGRKQGSISILGKKALDYKDLGDIGRMVGFVFDDADAQLIFTTVEEEVLSGLENRGFGVEEIPARLEHILTITSLLELRERAPHTLSGGQKQRVALATVLAGGSEIIILDEATAEMDDINAAKVFSILKSLKEEGRTIIAVEQKIDILKNIADRIIRIRDGMIISDLPAGEVSAPEQEETTPMTETGDIHDPVVSIRGLVHDYGVVKALAGIDLDIGRGEILAIIGENGSGKTTLSKHLNGLLRPTEGIVTVMGLDTGKASMKELAKHVGFVFQNPDTMLFGNTIREEIAFGLRNIGCDDIEGSITCSLSEVGLTGREETFPRSLSRGEKQRLAVACVIAMRPEIIVLDEPTTGLGPEESRQIMKLLQRLRDEGHTIIMVSHDLDIVKDYAERIVIMEKGRIISDMTKQVTD